MNFVESYRAQLLDSLSLVKPAQVDQAIQWFEEARDTNHHVFVCGNGGSAATASHFATDVVKGASFNREKRFRILALTDSLPTLTAYSNDVCFDCVFAEQMKNFANPGDVLLAISASGNSPNVLRATEYANELGCRTIALTGRDGGQLGKLAQLNIEANSDHMGRIEDVHMVVCHMIAYRFIEN